MAESRNPSMRLTFQEQKQTNVLGESDSGMSDRNGSFTAVTLMNVGSARSKGKSLFSDESTCLI